ncbi:nucleolar complex-associated protein 2 [Vigna umbellata]|uniref:nucleolar complex-associated protein 2 n=1 Tax=Vigna umbellata TaxID=87088 RepID=UPI001F5E5371|nr:nucleolar complex-associated protein 2 [Vigna umbellata]XP_047165076.1 nucleolar complex-associated protein 2 [Vigna umbellata]XP_047165077.1 nucleolar complex-associated protein 2 [Vigna umbellata]
MGAKKDTETKLDGENSVRQRSRKKPMPESGAREHKEQLQKLSEKDPEFYEFLKEHDQELLQFSDDDLDDDVGNDIEDEDLKLDEEASEDEIQEKELKSSKEVITTSMVDLWCKSIQENGSLSALRSLMRAFRTACHYGDDGGNESMAKLSVMSSTVFNKIMLTVLTEMDGILRKLFKLPASGGKKENITDLMATKHWNNYGHLVKSYLGNALHVLNQMTDTEMISFTLRRLKYSLLFLAAVPSLLRKYIKVVLHFWGTGGGALPVVSYLFMRDLCIRIGSGCIDECFKGIYKAYVLNCHFVNAVKLKHIRFLGNCVIELLGVDLAIAYQHAFIYIRQLAMILRDALNAKTKESFRKVYEWKFINCLELWTGAVCAYSSESDFKQLAYPLTQIISGVARLVPTARYFPLRLRCIRMLNQIAASTHSFVPVSMLLLDMLEMKELNRPPTGGVGKAVDLRSILKVSKLTLKTRAFQEACVISVVEELAEHLAQWSYSVAFMELSFIPLVRLRSFCKLTKVERFRKEMRQLIRQIEASANHVNEKRMSISFLPNDPAAASFLEDEKKSASSALSKYVLTLRQRAEQKNNSLMESSVLVGEESSKFGNEISESDEEDARNNEKGAAVFSSSWLPGNESKTKEPEETKRKRKKQQKERAIDDDVVEDLVLSSDEEMPSSHSPSAGKNDDADHLPSKRKHKQKKHRTKRMKKN